MTDGVLKITAYSKQLSRIQTVGSIIAVLSHNKLLIHVHVFILVLTWFYFWEKEGKCSQAI